MDLFLIYLWLKLDAVGCVLVVVCVIGAFAAFLTVMKTAVIDEKPLLPIVMGAAVFMVPLIVLTTLLPTSRDVAVLVGASYALDLARSPEGAKVGALLRGKANEILDAEIAKLAHKK